MSQIDDEVLQRQAIPLDVVRGVSASARTLVQALCELIPPMLLLLEAIRAELCFDLDELSFLAALMVLDRDRGVDTTFGSHEHLVALADLADWEAWHHDNTRALHQKIQYLLVSNSREGDLEVLALLDGLQTALRKIASETGDRSLALDRALQEVFELD